MPRFQQDDNDNLDASNYRYADDDDDFSEEDDGCHNGISFEYQGHP